MPKYKVADYRIASFDPGVKGQEPITPDGVEVAASREKQVLDAAKASRRKLVKIEDAATPAVAPELTISGDAGRVELIDAGYTSDSQVEGASDEELLALDGVGPKTLEKIREATKGSD